MTFEIKHRSSCAILFALETESLKLCVEAAVLSEADLRGAVLSEADLGGAVLSEADLREADLRRADLRGADLSEADLSGADLSGAVLSEADLREADLRGADLSEADLRGADLRGADLGGADLREAVLGDDTIIDGGYKWGEYLTQLVPALLTAGGRALSEIACAQHWECHQWDNCPMAAAFGAPTLEAIPPLYRREAERFIQFFDAGMIPLDRVLGAAASKPMDSEP